MEGQISELEFDATCNRGEVIKRTSYSAITRHGSTINYWIKHNDNSWTNTHCKTIY